MAFVGPNGAGKTTTIHSLLGFLKPSSGEARLFGQLPSPAVLSRVGYQSETFHGFPFYTARESLRFYGLLAGMSRREVEEITPRMLDRLALRDAADRRINRFSKGMTQRLGLAQALMHSPELLILDEPTSGLDPDGRQLVLDILLEEKARGATVFLSSHVLSEVEQVSDHVVMVRGGTLVLSASITELNADQLQWEIVVRKWRPEYDSLIEGTSARLNKGSEQTTVVVDAPDKQALLAKLSANGAEITSLQPLHRSGLERAYRDHAGVQP